MKIVHVPGGEYQDTLGSYANYKRFDDGSDTDIFFYGHNATKREDIKQKYAHYKRKAYLNLEAPCSFLTGDNTIKAQEYFDEVYTICPYTAKWMNERGVTKHIPIIEPYPEERFVQYDKLPEKKKDVIYHGGIHSHLLSRVIDEMMNFDYIFVNMVKDSRATHRNIRSQRKWDLIASAKCSVVANLLFPNRDHIANLKRYDGWKNNEAFKQDPIRVIPQSKARVIEAAACQTLNLVYKDDWNVIEMWFDKDEFVYWESMEELRYLIDDVSRNFHNYVPVIEKAHEKAKRYTVRNFINMVNENGKGDTKVH